MKPDPFFTTPDTSKLDLDDVVAAAEESLVGMVDEGFCTSCAESQYQVESDAGCRECESCGEHAVWGAGTLLMFMA